jgi:type IV secretory pathway VirJ component
VILYTGDGGWKSLALNMANFFQNNKVPLVGLDVRKYFWNKKSQLEIAISLEVMIEHYCEAWHKTKVILVGYSFGAEILPFAAGELPEEIKPIIKKVILIAPGQSAQFEVTLESLLDYSSDGLPVLSELSKICTGTYIVICDDSPDALCTVLDQKYDCSILKGGHHFDDDFQNLDLLIWNKINTPNSNLVY